MNARTAIDIALDLDAAACSSFVKLEAAAMLRQQHAEIERLRETLTDDHENLWEECLVLRKYVGSNMLMSDFRSADDMRAEIERLTALNSALTAKDNVLVIASARLDEKIDSLTAERDTAIAAAVAAEREACAAACRRRAESAGLYGSASAGALQCERDIHARSTT